MINPNKYIRGGVIPMLKTATGLIGVWHKKVPKTVTPIPDKYILITSQTKNRFAVAKGCFDWLCTLNVDIFNINPQGYTETSTVDDIEENVLNSIPNLTVAGFVVKNTALINSIDLDVETQEYSIDRRVLTYELWLNKA